MALKKTRLKRVVSSIKSGTKKRVVGKKRASRPKSKTPSQLKKEADAIFSKWVRTSNADSEGMIQCYTCPFTGPISKMQNGHLVSRFYLATRYDERNCRPQCITCNVWRNGRVPEFAAKLQQELGAGIVEELYEKARTLMVGFDYQMIIDTYTPKYKALLEE